MGWYTVASLLSDNRIKFLTGFVFAALVIAIILVVVETILRKKHMEKNRKLQQTPSDRIKIYLASGKSLQDKLAFIDRTAKSYFNDMYNFPSTSSYSFLIKELEKKGLEMEVKFCKEMFSIFYSKKEIFKSQISDVGKMLIEIEQHRTVENKDLDLINSDKMKIPISDIKKDIKQKEESINPKFNFKFFDRKKDVSLENKDLVIDKQERIGEDIKKMAAVDENETKKKLENLKKHDDKLREEAKKIENFKKESEERIKKRKELVDERILKKTMEEEERKKKIELEKKRKEDEKQRRKEMFWRAKAQRQERMKMKDKEREELKRLAIEKKMQEKREEKKLKEEKIEKLNKEKIIFEDEAKNSISNEGIAARIVRLQKEKLNL